MIKDKIDAMKCDLTDAVVIFEDKSDNDDDISSATSETKIIATVLI